MLVPPLYNRFLHLRSLWREGLWGRWVIGGWGIVAVAEAVRDEFLSPDLQAKLKVPVMVHLSLLAGLNDCCVIDCSWVGFRGVLPRVPPNGFGCRSC